MEIRQQLLTARHYKSALESEYEIRAKKNKYYSMRAFARDLKISPSRLSDILKGRYGLTERTAKSISEALKFNERESSLFWALVESETSKSTLKRKAAQLRLQQYLDDFQFKRLNQDVFEVISHWYHLAILELTNLNGFDSKPATVARLLGLTKAEAQTAIERLLRLGLLKQEDSGLTPTNNFTLAGNETPSLAIQNFHREIIKKSFTSIRKQPVEKREYSSSIVSLNLTDIPQAKKAIQDFRNHFLKQFGAGNKKDSLYALSIQFFDLISENPSNSRIS